MSLQEALLEMVTPLHADGRTLVSAGWPAPWVFLSRVRGHLTLAGARRIGEALLSRADANPRILTLCHEWSGMTDYDSEARVHLTDVARKVFPNTKAVHFLVGSRTMAFAIRTASFVFQGLTVHTEMELFGQAVMSAMADPHPFRSQ
jgi:hypothetical protein